MSEESRKERIELHCHSKSGGNATMYAGELIRYADMRNMPAIAITDRSNIQAFPELGYIRKRRTYSTRPIMGMEMLIRENDGGEVYTQSILIKNESGKQNLYKLISESEWGEAYPVYDKETLMRYREGLLIGSGAENGKLRRMAVDGESEETLRQAVRELDYIELLPYECDKDINKCLLALGEQEGVTVVAVSDAHYLEEKDKTAWKVINNIVAGPSNRHGVHLLSTEEMLKAFSYLPADKAEEIVVENTHKIASLCEDIKIMPDKKMYPVIPGAADRLRKLCEEALDSKYDDKEREAAREYMEKELHALDLTLGHSAFLQMREMAQKSGLKKYDIIIRGTGAGSMVAYLLDIGEVDPIRFKLNPETIYANHFDREIDLSLNIPSETYVRALDLMGTLEGVGKAVDVKEIISVRKSDAEEILEKYEKHAGPIADRDMREQICGKIMGNYTGMEQKSIGTCLFPEGCDPVSLMPVKRIPDGSLAAYYDHMYLRLKLYITELISNGPLSALRQMSARTGVDLADVPYYNEEIMEMIKRDENGCYGGCADLYDFSSDQVKNMFRKLKPESFDDLVKIMSMMRGNGIWEDNGEKLADEYGIGIKDLISNRDDISDLLLSKGFDRMKAFDISEYVRKGRATLKRPEWIRYKKEMFEAGVPSWYIESCEKIRYLFPRAYVAASLMRTMRLAWFRIKYPKDYLAVSEEYDLL